MQKPVNMFYRSDNARSRRVWIEDQWVRRAEYATGEVNGKDLETYYATIACNLGDSFRAVVRHDVLDPNTDTKAQREAGLELRVTGRRRRLRG